MVWFGFKMYLREFIPEEIITACDECVAFAGGCPNSNCKICDEQMDEEYRQNVQFLGIIKNEIQVFKNTGLGMSEEDADLAIFMYG